MNSNYFENEIVTISKQFSIESATIHPKILSGRVHFFRTKYLYSWRTTSETTSSTDAKLGTGCASSLFY